MVLRAILPPPVARLLWPVLPALAVLLALLLSGLAQGAAPARQSGSHAEGQYLLAEGVLPAATVRETAREASPDTADPAVLPPRARGAAAPWSGRAAPPASAFIAPAARHALPAARGPPSATG